MKTETLQLGNLCCVECADSVQKALQSNPRIVAASVDYLKDRVTVSYKEDAIKIGEIAAIIETAGHGCSMVRVVDASQAASEASEVLAQHDMAATAMPHLEAAPTLASAPTPTPTPTPTPIPAVMADSARGKAHVLPPVIMVDEMKMDGHAADAAHGGGGAQGAHAAMSHGTSTGTSTMAHLDHQTQMGPISMGTKMDRMQYEMPATAAAHVHSAEHTGAMNHAGMDHDMSDPKMARAMETDMRNRFWVALVLTVPTLLYSPLFTQFFKVKLPAPVDPNWIMFVLSTPVVWWSGWIFISGAYQSLKHRALNMSVLIATGVLAAYLFSVLILFVGGEAFFEAAAMLVTFVLFGH